MAARTRPRLPKLPASVEAFIALLERDVAHAEAELREALAAMPTRIDADPYGENRRYLPEDQPISFSFGPRQCIRVRLDRDSLDINGDDPIAISPRSSNAISIRIVND